MCVGTDTSSSNCRKELKHEILYTVAKITSITRKTVDKRL